MNIALDAMGGDNAPRSIIEGAILAKKEVLPEDANLWLIGQENVIKEHLVELGASEDDFTIVNADQVVGMSEHPTKAISQKQNSSIVVGYSFLKAG